MKGRPKIQAPPGGASHFRLAWRWVALFPAVALLLAVLKVFGPRVLTEDQARLLTESGRYWIRPERDLPIYILGCALCVGTGAVFVDRERVPNRLGRLSWWLGGTLLLGELILWSGPAWLRREGLQLAVAAAGAGCIAWNWAISRPGSDPEDQVLSEGFDTGRRFSLSWKDAAVLMGLLLFLVVRDAPRVAGGIFVGEEMHHWDFFAMAPTLGFQGGAALGRDVYTQYGVGWPMLFTAMGRLVPVSYALMITTASVLGAIYWSASYFLVRYFTNHRLFSLAVTVLGLTLSLFCGMDRGNNVWSWPSSTPMRAPFDVVLLLSTAIYLHRPTAGWAITSGFLLGISVLFGTDTGLFLGIGLLIFWGALLWAIPTRERLGHFSFSSSAAILAGLTGFTIAGRALPDLGFFKGLLEGVSAASGGLGSLPIADLGARWIVVFAGMVIVYAGAVGQSLGRLFRRGSRPFDIWVMSSGTYGLLTLLVFVGRSHPYNLFHVSGFFVVFSALLLARHLTAGLLFGSNPARRQSLLSKTAVCTGLVTAVVLLESPGLAAYPGFWNPRHPNKTSVSLRSRATDLTGLPETLRPYRQDFREATEYLRRQSNLGRSVAVLDGAGTVFYLESGVKPWGRYCPTFQFKTTFKADVEEFQAVLLRSKPEVVLMSRKSDTWPRRLASEPWRRTRETVRQVYSLTREFGLIEIWELR